MEAPVTGGCIVWDTLIDFFFFQAEDGIRAGTVTGVQTCALPIWTPPAAAMSPPELTTKRAPPPFLWQEAQDASLKSGPKPLLPPEGSAHLRSKSARPSSISPASTSPAGKAMRTMSAIRVQNRVIGYGTPWFGTGFSRPPYERTSP